jgi:hypothetical protein
MLPVPHLVDKIFSCVVVTRLAFNFEQSLFDDGLGGNSSMIKSRNEEDGLAQHAVPESISLVKYLQRKTYDLTIEREYLG